MKAFYWLLANTTLVAIANLFVWSSVIYWIYLETGSVLATSTIGGLYLVTMAVSSIWFGSLVDHNKKKHAILISSVASLALYAAALLLFLTTPSSEFATIASWRLWLFVVVLLCGVIAGNIRNIAIPTLTALLVAEDRRDRANGLVGTATGAAFAVASVAAGFALAFSGMVGVLLAASGVTLLAVLHLLVINIPEKEIVQSKDKPRKLDLKGTLAVVKAVPGLFALIFFTTFNNFLGGVFMSLMDAYGLSLVSVQVWGTLWGFLSFGFIFGGLYIAKWGLGKSPLKTLFLVNVILWTISIFFAIQPSIVLLGVGLFLYICLVPFIEATEHTVIQKVVPQERLGRVFGFAQSVEQMASPVSAFTIGPIAQFVFIPFMTSGLGVELIGNWFGVGPGRGIALVFITAGLCGLLLTTLAWRSRAYKLLSAKYRKPASA